MHIEFGFIFDQSAYENVLYNRDYNEMGVYVMFDILITLKNKYKFEYQWSFSFENDPFTYKMINFIVDINWLFDQEIKLFNEILSSNSFFGHNIKVI